MEIITKSAKETANLGQKLAADLKSGTVIALYGDLGSGKTTFVQGLAKGLGIKKRILSPTFVLMRQYQDKDCFFYHVDLYRINKPEETQSLGLEEIFNDRKGIVVIEWAEKMKKILPRKRIDIFFEYIGENKRKIKIEEKNSLLA